MNIFYILSAKGEHLEQDIAVSRGLGNKHDVTLRIGLDEGATRSVELASRNGRYDIILVPINEIRKNPESPVQFRDIRTYYRAVYENARAILAELRGVDPSAFILGYAEETFPPEMAIYFASQNLINALVIRTPNTTADLEKIAEELRLSQE
jgi:hypothetical protein